MYFKNLKNYFQNLNEFLDIFIKIKLHDQCDILLTSCYISQYLKCDKNIEIHLQLNIKDF